MGNEHNLKTKTETFWKLSSIWNGRIVEPLTTQDALMQLKSILESVGPKRMLSGSAGLLMADIIKPKRVRKKKIKNIVTLQTKAETKTA